MVKKYKHKLTGKTCTEKDTFYYIDSEGNLPKWIVENSSDWEEVKEKEYEILRKKFVSDWWKIISVKRLSDGEIFTVDDKVKHKLGAKFTIKDIRVYEGNLQLTSGTGVVASIDDIEHLREPLFVTEDGVQIFIGDIPFLWKVTDNFEIVYDHYEVTKGYNFFAKGRTFSTKKAAKKWIDENKPKYSKKQVNEALQSSALGTIMGGYLIIDDKNFEKVLYDKT